MKKGVSKVFVFCNHVFYFETKPKFLLKAFVYFHIIQIKTGKNLFYHTKTKKKRFRSKVFL